ncbi:MAG: TonB-dependent receptor, partial [Flavobacterium sp.]
YYAIGDNIWFKAYVTDSKTSLPSNKSNILYVELITERDSIARKIKIPMQSGITWGDFKLSDSLTEGNYRIRAYTQWMRNAGPDFFFDKTIKIGNGWTNKIYTKTSFQYRVENGKEHVATTIKFLNGSSIPYANAQVNYHILLGSKKSPNSKAITNANGELNVNITNTSVDKFKGGYIIATLTLPDGIKTTKQIPIKTTTNKVDVQFFPEGGNLVESLPCKVAVKAVNGNGLGEAINGTVIDNEGVEILTFETALLGMSSFAINPMAGKTYTAKIKFRDGSEQTIALPKAANGGYVLSANNIDSTKMTVKVMLSADLLNKGELNLLLQHNGQVLFTAKVPTTKQIANIVVPKTSFPSGIATLTLFNQQNIPVAERLTFINNISDKIELIAQDLKQSYEKKGAVNATIIATSNNKPIQGSFSVSVTNTTVVKPDLENESNILTSLLLTSDLVGYVEKPNRYFIKNDVETKIDLDNLLLTQGWRKIIWSNIANNQVPSISFPAERAMKISGVVTNSGKPVVKGKVSLMSSSAGIFATETETDQNGRFVFDQIAFNEGTKFAIKAVTNTDHKGVKITMDDLPAQLVLANDNLGDVESDVNESLKSYLKLSSDYFNDQESKGFLTRVNQLKTVEIVAKANKAAPSSANLNGAGNADYVFSADEMKNSTSLSHFLSGRLVGMRVENGYVKSTRTDGVTTVIVDGVTYIDGQGGDALGATPVSLEELNILDIESIEVLKNIATTTIYGHAGQNGVIIITTKSGQGRTTFNTRAPGMMSYQPLGFYLVKQFYSPKYDTKQDANPDYRPTVFWEPNLISDASGKANFSYYNTDQSGNYRMVIEGIDADGNLARKVFTYEVK